MTLALCDATMIACQRNGAVDPIDDSWPMDAPEVMTLTLSDAAMVRMPMEW
eukprot:CAMPEP_0198358506 /NCGR_PEP_ID=MMETSP1450-20131203/131035_1 /TAXON_ID=753684 ORGANISM="Madagascaria erythrocladiodes, Strain CCMP3234" /NCGR_SAMPLE_ID=MMETSP1450 /ASSEMBLY_ACC=CAM_ASM_001115 /LENGTH=50 /DNA_ID=CAMNT_0044065257 /DNA_START=23 /DNA_END=173 /DNA_ORIENTATION=-